MSNDHSPPPPPSGVDLDPMSKAKRIQRKRTRNWRMPKNAVYVGRPSKWGNPFRVECDDAGQWFVSSVDGLVKLPSPSKHEAKASAVRLFRQYLANDGSQPGAIRDCGGKFIAELAKTELRGKDLACWCDCGPCHADVLLEIANR